MSVPYKAGSSAATLSMEFGASSPLFEARLNSYHPAGGTYFYSVTKDGRRFLVNHVEQPSEPVLNLVVNWTKAFAIH